MEKIDFAHLVSHELRTPVAIAREEVAQILDGMCGAVSKKQQRALSMVLKQMDRLGRMIGKFSRLAEKR